jgi:hypothetical protein
LAAASASRVRWAILLRPFSATAAWICRIKGSTSAPNSDDDEGHLLRHQPGDEMHVARQAVELGDDDRRSLALAAVAVLARRPGPAGERARSPLPSLPR